MRKVIIIRNSKDLIGRLEEVIKGERDYLMRKVMKIMSI